MMKIQNHIIILIASVLIGLISQICHAAEMYNYHFAFLYKVVPAKLESTNSNFKKILVRNSKILLLREIDEIKSYNTIALRHLTFQDTTKSNEKLKPSNAEKTKKTFFGKIYTYGLPPIEENGPCEVGVFKTFYVFGIKVFGPKPVMTPYEKNEEILTQEVVGCGEEYVPIKEKDKKDKKDKKRKRKGEDSNKEKMKMDTINENLKDDKRIRKENDFLEGL